MIKVIVTGMTSSAQRTPPQPLCPLSRPGSGKAVA